MVCNPPMQMSHEYYILRLIIIIGWLEHLAETSEDKFQTEVERREHYHFHRLQIQLRNVLTIILLILPLSLLMVNTKETVEFVLNNRDFFNQINKYMYAPSLSETVISGGFRGSSRVSIEPPFVRFNS